MTFLPERIICLTEETVETLYLLEEDGRIAGVSGYAVRPPAFEKRSHAFRHLPALPSSAIGSRATRETEALWRRISSL
jgi:hypothetical protein